MSVDADVGKTLSLLGETTLVAVDAFSGEELTLSGGAVTTELPFDTLAQGKGTVVAAGEGANATPSATNTSTP